MVRLDFVTRLHLQRGCEHLHRLGARPTAEFLTEVSEKIGGLPTILGLLLEYERRLNPRLLQFLADDRFPRRSLRPVPQGLMRPDEGARQ